MFKTSNNQHSTSSQTLNNQTSKPKHSFDLEERTLRFSENLIDLCRKLSQNTVTKPIISQVIRSGTSMGANYCEANESNSKKDFINKIAIAKKVRKEKVSGTIIDQGPLL